MQSKPMRIGRLFKSSERAIDSWVIYKQRLSPTTLFFGLDRLLTRRKLARLYDYVVSLSGMSLVLVLLDIVATFVNQNNFYRHVALD